MSIIYGVDTTKNVTPLMVRDAIITCFCAAHAAQTGFDNNDTGATKKYCQQIVQNAFSETQGDFNQPTKASLLASLPWLANFSKAFRDQSVIQKHMNEIQILISFLKE